MFVDNIQIVGDNIAGGLLTASYDFHGGVEGDSILNWYRDGQKIIGEKSLTYEIRQQDSKHNIRFGVRPVDSGGNVGEQGLSDGIYIEDLEAISVEIFGRSYVGEELVGEYVVNHPSLLKSVELEWYVDGVVVGNELRYILQAQDIGKKVWVRVIPINIYNYVGIAGESNRIVVAEPEIAVEKTYQIKVFDYEGNFKRTISNTLLMNNVNFTNSLNGGQGELTLRLKLEMGNDWFKQSDIIQVIMFDGYNLHGKIIYTGTLMNISRIYDGNKEYIELSCLGLYSLMSRILFDDGGEYEFRNTESPSLTMNKIVDCFNGWYIAGWIKKDGIKHYSHTRTIEFIQDYCHTAMSKIQRAMQTWNFFVGADGNVWYSDEPRKNHKLKMGLEVEGLEVLENIQNTVNTLFVSYAEPIGEQISEKKVVGPFQDGVSEVEYGPIHKVLNAGGIITNSSSATSMGEDHLEKNKHKIRQIKGLTVNDNYQIEEIQPGDTITILNLDYEVEELLITKVAYSKEMVRLELEKSDSLAEAFISLED